MKKVWFVVIALVLAVGMVGCVEKPTETPNETPKAEKVELDVGTLVMLKESSTTLSYSLQPQTAVAEASYSSSNSEVVEVSKEGVVRAKDVGSATVTVRVADDVYAECKVYVGHVMVQKETPTTSTQKAILKKSATASGKIRYVGGKKGETLWGSVGEALGAAEKSATVVIGPGEYGEALSLSQDVTLLGVDRPTFESAVLHENIRAKLLGLRFSGKEFPPEGGAIVKVGVGCELEMKQCILSVASDENPSGGYGLLVEKGCKGLVVEENTISNLRYGVYVAPTDQNVRIKKNQLSHMEMGIGLDIRQQNSDQNYPTKGEIGENEFNEVVKKTQFLHYGEAYEGEFDFADHEKEMESGGNAPSGGSGLLE